MDESWRMRMGMQGLPHRRSTEDSLRRSVFPITGTLDPDDFADVFGGPPRSVLSWRFANGVGTKQSNSFYEEAFRPPEVVYQANNAGKSFPAFRTSPANEEGFYSDIFRSDDERRSRERSGKSSKAKSKSSSVLSSEELSPFRPMNGDDVALSSVSSKLRPINIPSRWNSAEIMPEEHHHEKKPTGMPTFPTNYSAYTDNRYLDDDFKENFRSCCCNGFSRQVPSPETISLEPHSYQSIKVSIDDLELNSPSSVVSSVCQDKEAKASFLGNVLLEEEEECDDEIASSYVIEITSFNREGPNEAVSIDEAIAWAKEKFQRQISDVELSIKQQENEHYVEVEGKLNACGLSSNGNMQSIEEERQRNWRAEEGTLQLGKMTEMDELDEEINLWSAGKETNIRLLLSTLHQILWQNSGWCSIPLTSLIGSSQVKKAYQKARLCLHPDKLQQRGATGSQKYVAEKAFSILQDAWTIFISQDVL